MRISPTVKLSGFLNIRIRTNQKGNTMIKIGRHVNGIMLNELEFILDQKGDIKLFPTKREAIRFCKKKGMTEEQIYWLCFKYVAPPKLYERIKIKKPLTEAQRVKLEGRY